MKTPIRLLSFLVVLAGSVFARETPSLARLHDEIMRRFIAADGTVLDYADFDGRVPLPTPEECAAGQPNALGWWSPIENGGFFGGLYLDALCNRWRALRTAEAAAEAHRIAGGLLKLAEAGSTPGFIARGFATDGRSHYAASSSDQTYPWFYGLWRYATSGLPDAEQRRRVVATMERVALGLERNDWKMPGDRPGFGDFGHWSGGFAGTRGILSGAEPQFDAAARFLFVLRALHDLTGRERWAELYRQALDGKPRGSELTRRQICAGGVRYVAPGESPRYPESPPLWTSASSQAGLRALRDLERDPAVRADFQRGLDANAASAARFVAGYRSYDNANSLGFDFNWRALNALWRPQPEIGAAVELGTLQYRAWNRQSPRRLAEAERMRDPLFAAWIVVLADNPAIVDPVRPEIAGALGHFAWDKLYTSFCFMGENVHWQLVVDGR